MWGLPRHVRVPVSPQGASGVSFLSVYLLVTVFLCGSPFIRVQIPFVLVFIIAFFKKVSDGVLVRLCLYASFPLVYAEG